VLAGGQVSNGFVRPAFASEHHMLGLDGLVRTGCRRDLDELTEQLPAEHPVVLESLVATFELGDVVRSGAPRRHRAGIKALEQIGPEIGHALSVSPILRQ
jgi:hypothetical protein